MFCHSLFQSREKTLIFTLEISTISILRHKEQSSSKISWVYEKYIGITQATYTKTALDAHKSRAQESHTMCTSHKHRNHTGHTCRQQHEKRFSNFSRHVLHHKELIQEHPHPGMNTFSLDLYSIMVLKPLFSVMLDLESPQDRCMHPLRSRAWEQSNPGFPTKLSSKGNQGHSEGPNESLNIRALKMSQMHP